MVKYMVAFLKKYYALPGHTPRCLHLNNGAGDMGAILRLNEVGRRYLVQDGSSISKDSRRRSVELGE
jgi:hypothetical protein